MEKFKRHADIDYSKYGSEVGKEALYGLPQEIAFCKLCVISNQRPNSVSEFKHTKSSRKPTILFDEEGICAACRYAAEKEKIDWGERERELRNLCDRYRRNDGRYDCVVPGSGGKDSFYAAHLLKYKYGMHPLTTTWAPHIYTDWGWKNFQSWLHAGFDNVLFTPNGRVHRLLTRLAVEQLLHPFQPFILGQKNLAPKLAVQYDIQLVFYGENEAEYGNPTEDNDNSKRNWDYFTLEDQSQIFLSGTSVADLKECFGIDENSLEPYFPVNPDKIEKKEIKVYYMGYFERWHPQSTYYYAVKHGGFQAAPERTVGTYSKYNSIDDKVDDLHYFTTFIKFGLGRATYDAAQEIRNHDITREEGEALAKRYDGEIPERFMDELLEYLSLPESEFPKAHRMFEQPILDWEYFSHLCDRFRSPHLWKWEEGEWKLRKSVWE